METKKVASVIIALVLLSFLAVILLSVSMAWFFFKSPPKTGGIPENVLKSSMKEMMGYASLDDIPLAMRNSTLLSFDEKDGAKEFRLSAEPVRWEYSKGSYVTAWGYNGQVPGPEISVNEGDKVRIIFTNNLPKPTTVYWHGLNVPGGMNGSEASSEIVEPDETRVYEFEAGHAGTYFYHAHGSSGKDEAQQLDMGLYGAFIIKPNSNFSEKLHQNEKYDKDFVLFADEWKILPDGINAVILPDDSSRDYNVFTANGMIFPDTEALDVRKGDKVLIRIINSGTSETHVIHIHGHSFKVVAVDGNPVQAEAQIVRDTLPVSPGERYDIEVIADNPGSWIIHCHQLHHADGGMIVPLIYEGYQAK